MFVMTFWRSGNHPRCHGRLAAKIVSVCMCVCVCGYVYVRCMSTRKDSVGAESAETGTRGGGPKIIVSINVYKNLIMVVMVKNWCDTIGRVEWISVADFCKRTNKHESNLIRLAAKHDKDSV